MDRVYGLYLVMILALVLCNYSLAEWNVTEATADPTVTSCHHHGDGNNCTANAEEDELSGHFSKCPKEYEHYCVHGKCRYVTEQQKPSCRCMDGFEGSRCEYVHFAIIGEKRRIVIIAVVAGLVVIILLIVFIFFNSHRRCRLCWRRRRRREERRNGTEKHSMMDTSAAHVASDSPELTHTDSV